MGGLLKQPLQRVLGTAGKPLGNFKKEDVDVERKAIEDVTCGRKLLVSTQLHKD